MENLVPLGTGNSRFMKSNIPASTTLAQLIQMLNNGTFPYDIGTINPAGISQQGTPLNKDTLLKDATAALFGLGTDAVPDDVLAYLGKYAPKIATGFYVGTNTYGESNPNSLTFDFEPKFVLIFWAEGGNPNNAMAFLSADGGCSYMPAGPNGQYYYATIITVNITGNTITWYASSLQIQMNGKVKYQYFAIG